MKNGFIIEPFGDRMICIRGVGKMFYQDGFPISLAIEQFKKRGIEVSLFHVADECLKNGWSAKTTLSKLKEDFDIKTDWVSLEAFCNAEYEDQREMIFQYLFGYSSASAMSDRNKIEQLRQYTL